MRPQFRSYFQNIVDMMLAQQESIKSFIKKCSKKHLKNGTKKKAPGLKNKTRRLK